VISTNISDEHASRLKSSTLKMESSNYKLRGITSEKTPILKNYGRINKNYESGMILEADVMGSFRKTA
jgi:hypothetical protein